jgi:hypothetical protein
MLLAIVVLLRHFEQLDERDIEEHLEYYCPALGGRVGGSAQRKAAAPARATEATEFWIRNLNKPDSLASYR